MSAKTLLPIVLTGIVCCGAFSHTQENTMPTQETDQKFVFNLDRLNQQRASNGEAYLKFLDVATMSCGVYHLAAGSRDRQSPHTEDEVYFVLSGTSKFHMDGQEFDVEPGEVLFVPAFKKHYFHDITEDLTLLVFFSKVSVATKE